MGLPMNAILAGASIAATVGGKLFAGFQASKAAESEARDIEEQATLEREELLEESRRQKKEARKFLAKQSVAFVKGGVSLAGSPMLVLEETQDEADKQFAAGRRQADARFRFGMRKAERVSAGGRSSLLGNIIGGVASGIGMTLKARQLKMFSP